MVSGIAIVGMACVFPDARSPRELWENVLSQRRAFRSIPAKRLRLEDYLSNDRGAPDSIYSSKAAVIEGYEFDRVAFSVAGDTFRTADMAHWLALDIASRALKDGGFDSGNGLPHETTGVFIGNTLTGEFSRANSMRLRWPYVRRVLDASLAAEGWPLPQRSRFLKQVETSYKEPFPNINEESLAGGLSNTIAGRICNHFDLKGGGYTIDGACASSLLAVANACSSLMAQDIDVALAGGVDLSLDPFELVGFAKAGALSAGEMRVYDTRSDGFLPGEGCGLVLLMRHEDAVAQGKRIYASIKGWGISSDGKGGITRPEVEGQMLALKRAYRRAGFGIETVGYFEGHGTGTSVGDTVELQAISRARNGSASNGSPAVIGTIKANIGHTKAAAGIAGLIKATLAVNSGIIPPTTGCEHPHSELTRESPAIKVLKTAEPWPNGQPRRAGISSMGFGGIDAHVVVEANGTRPPQTVAASQRALICSAQDAELILLSAASVDELVAKIDHLLGFAAKISLAELSDLAHELQRTLSQGLVRAAIVTSSPASLAERLEKLRTRITSGRTTEIDAGTRRRPCCPSRAPARATRRGRPGRRAG
jgi:enediyne polyketide synthase